MKECYTEAEILALYEKYGKSSREPEAAKGGAQEMPGIGLAGPVAGKTIPEIATPSLPTGKPKLTLEQRKILDFHFHEEAMKANVSPEDLGPLYEDALDNFVPGEDHVINSGNRKGEVVPGADVAKAMRSFIINRKVNALKPKSPKDFPLPDKETGMTSISRLRDRDPDITPEHQAQLDALDVVERISGPSIKQAIADLLQDKTVDEVAKDRGIPRNKVSRRNIRAKKLIFDEYKRILARARADPETVANASRRDDELEAKRSAGEKLSKEEAEDFVLAKVLKAGEQGTIDFGFLYAAFPPEFRKAMEDMGGAIAKIANEENLNKIEDFGSMASRKGRGGLQKIKEGLRVPVRSKHSRELSGYLLENDREASRVTAEADKYFKDYFALEAKDPERFSKITQTLIDEDQAKKRFTEDELVSERGYSPGDLSVHKRARRGVLALQKYEMWRHKKALKEELDKWLAKEDPDVRDEASRLISEGRNDPARARDLIKEAASLKKGEPDTRLFDTNKRATVIAGEHLAGLSKVGSSYMGNPGYLPHLRHGRYMMEIKGVPVEQDPNLAGIEEEPRAITIDAEMFDELSQTRRFAEKYHVGEVVEFPRPKDGVPTEYEITSITDPKKPKDMTTLNVPEEGFMRAVNAFPIYEKTLAKHMSDEEIKHIRQVLSDETLRFFAQGRLAKRKNIAGWSQDIPRSLKQFSASFPHAINRRYSIPKAQEIIEKLPTEDAPYSQDLLEYWRGTKDKEGPVNQAIRSAIYNWYLGLKPAFYLLNSSQPLSTTFPVLVSLVGYKKAAAIFGSTSKKLTRIIADFTVAFKKDRHAQLLDITKNAPYLSIAEKRTIERMASGGSIGASRTREIIGKSDISKVLNIFGELSEKQNRVFTAIAGVHLAKTKGAKIQEAMAIADDLNDKTQFVYSKANRMKIARGWLAPVTMFKSYFMNFWSLQHELLQTASVFKSSGPDQAGRPLLGSRDGVGGVAPKHNSFGLSTAILIALGGVATIPGYEYLKELIPRLLRATGIISDDEPIEKQIYDAEKAIEKHDLSRILLNGIPSLANVSGTMFGSGDPFGIAGLQIVKSIGRTVRGMSSDAGADWLERFARVAPTEAKRLIRLYQLVVKKKFATDEYGRLKITDEDLKRFPEPHREWAKKATAALPKPSDVGAWEKILMAMGFQTESNRKYSVGTYAIKSVGKSVLSDKGGMNREIGKLIASSSNEVLAGRFKRMTPRVLEYNFSGILNRLPPDIRKEILNIKAESKRTGIAINYSSILSNIKEFIDQGNYQIRSNYGSRRKRVR